MFPIVPIACSTQADGVADLWRSVVRSLAGWLTQIRVPAREAVILLPQIWHLQFVRSAWSHEVGGWLPQLETPQTLARGWGPAPVVLPGMITFDVAVDRLTARGMLGSALRTSSLDSLALEHALMALVQSAQGMARAAALVPPEQREAHWQRCRDALTGPGSGAGRESAIALLALEWAALQPPPRSDVLFDPPVRVGAWAVVQAGGADMLAQAVLGHVCASVPCGLLNLDAEEDGEGRAPGGAEGALCVAVCDDFEDEAQRSAAVVLQHIAKGEVPVALVAQDRVLVRRVQALLARQQVALQDETGWKLTTTAAAATVMAWLRWFSPQATLDELLDAIKTLPDRQAEIEPLEADLRQAGWRRVMQVQRESLSLSAQGLWDEALGLRGLFLGCASLPLVKWVSTLGEALRSLGLVDVLASDAAGAQVLACLKLANDDAGWAEWVRGAGSVDWDVFVQWVDHAMEQAVFLPSPHPQAQVVVTPLSHALLRPFASVVFPGADSKHCGAPNGLHPLLTTAQAKVFGLPTAEAELAASWAALWQLMRVPRVTMLYRLNDDQDRLLPSSLLERLRLVWSKRPDQPQVVSLPEVRVLRQLNPEPVKVPSPVAPHLLPERMSASSCEALRSCPYRFFALRMLGLQTTDELEKEPEKRDYGIWLHEVLLRFHSTRSVPADAAQDAERLRDIARESQQAMGWDDAEFLPYWISLENLIDRYLRWVHQRDAQGVSWVSGELKMSAYPAQWKGVEMHGVIDRLDQRQMPHGTLIELIDYKTHSVQSLKTRVKDATEETQLAFYAALVLARDPDQSVRALYLPLDDKGEEIKGVDHPDLEEGARRLVEGIGMDLERLRQGASLLPLGRGSACEHCDARGLCRRDHWAEPLNLDEAAS